MNQDMNPSVSGRMILESPNVKCECGSVIFRQAVVLKKLSPVISGSGKEEFFPIDVFVCANCGKVPNEFMDKPNADLIMGNKKDKAKEETKIIL